MAGKQERLGASPLPVLPGIFLKRGRSAEGGLTGPFDVPVEDTCL